MKTRRLFLLLLVLLPVALQAQKRPLTHDDYDGWKSLSSQSITDDGLFVTYEINPQEGDGTLYLYNVKSGESQSYDRGNGAKFSSGSEYFVYKIDPPFALTQKAKRDKKKPDDMPKADMGIILSSGGDPIIVERVKSFALPEDEGLWMAYLLEKALPEKKSDGDAEKNAEEATPSRRPSGARGGRNGGSEGTELVIFNPVSGAKHSFKDVVDYAVADNGSAIGFLQVKTDSTKIKHNTLSLFNTSTTGVSELFKGDGEVKSFTFSKDGAQQAFLFTSDTTDTKIFDLWLGNGTQAQEVAGVGTPGIADGWAVSENGSISFSESGKRLIFGTAPAPVEEPKDTLLDEEKYRLDIWSWQDPVLQPQQKVNLSRDKRKSYTAVYHISSKKLIQLADEEMPDVRLLMKGDGDIAIGSSDLDYRKQTSWESNRYNDYYRVDVLSGKRTMVMKAAPSAVAFSPSGKQLVYWCIDSRSWKALPSGGGAAIDLTSKLGVAFHDELHDSPSEPSPYTRAPEWIEGERYIVVNDRFDLWKLDITGADAAVNLTAGAGRNDGVRYTYQSMEGRGGFRFGSSSDKIYLEPKETIWLDMFNEMTKDAGLAKLRINRPAKPETVVTGPYAIGSFSKAEDADRLIFTKGDYVNYPELYLSDLTLKSPLKLSETNPQQKDVNWGTTELVEWRSFDGQTLQGILYKPEDFDPAMKYPMIVYFYERSSDGLHRYNSPAPSASTVNRTYAVSNGYLVFVPDIPYVEGYPGQSAYNAIVSGTYAMMEQYPCIDPDRIGLDGQSWGGYQIAYLITQTNMFRCAFSGAPVSNMTSAYGGIRWGSGMSRMFQYEKTQSRIGGTLWEKPIHYIENSPIFFIPKVETPVLIMHNDEDGAVPWYQGIEFFVALRRLDKPAWLLSYNAEDHNLRRRANRKDLSVRKMQFFDHYLKDMAAPYWMEKGISQLEKGKIDGYELMK